MNDSIANTLTCAPRLRSDEVRSGIAVDEVLDDPRARDPRSRVGVAVDRRHRGTCAAAASRCGSIGSARSRRASSREPGAPAGRRRGASCPRASWLQSTSRRPSSQARLQTRTSRGGPVGLDQPCSSARVHFSARAGPARPGRAAPRPAPRRRRRCGRSSPARRRAGPASPPGSRPRARAERSAQHEDALRVRPDDSARRRSTAPAPPTARSSRASRYGREYVAAQAVSRLGRRLDRRPGRRPRACRRPRGSSGRAAPAASAAAWSGRQLGLLGQRAPALSASRARRACVLALGHHATKSPSRTTATMPATASARARPRPPAARPGPGPEPPARAACPARAGRRTNRVAPGDEPGDVEPRARRGRRRGSRRAPWAWRRRCASP